MPAAFVRALVSDVLDNPVEKKSTRQTISEYAGKIAGDENLKNIPRNSLAVKILSNAESKTNGSDSGEVICYPFFSSHISMPIKPGEEVWVMFEEYDPPSRSAIGYWISRVHGPRHVEDVNYAYSRRSYKTSTTSASTKKRTSDKFAEKESVSASTIDPSAPQQLDSTTSPTADPSEMIQLLQYASGVHRFEAVPRYTKRPGDFVIQGSNNSLIMLGEERGRSGKSEIAQSDSSAQVLQGMPAIDIVVGRKIALTAKKINMELGFQEIDKRIGDAETETDGDANFSDDAARIYLTANSDSSTGPDSLLSLRSPIDITGVAIIDNQAKKSGSFVVSKADNLRLISRKSVKILKEPTSDDGSAIVMDENGFVQIAAPKIFMTPYVAGTGINPQPYVRLDKLADFLSLIIEQQSSLVNQVIQLSTLISGYPLTAGLAAPLAIVNGNLVAVTGALELASSLMLDATRRTTLGSTVIYGE